MDHSEGEASECDAEAQHVADQVRLIELLHVAGQRARGRGDDHAGNAGSNQRELISLELWNQLAGGLFDHHYCSRPRSEGGTSAMVACSLSCSARMYAA